LKENNPRLLWSICFKNLKFWGAKNGRYFHLKHKCCRPLHIFAWGGRPIVTLVPTSHATVYAIGRPKLPGHNELCYWLHGRCMCHCPCKWSAILQEARIGRRGIRKRRMWFAVRDTSRQCKTGKVP
jgi:hypothetical protein